MSYYNETDDAAWTVTKWILIVTALLSILSGIGWCAHAVFYPVEQSEQVMERTMNADNMIYNYEWFHQREADWEAAGVNLENKEHELDQFMETAGPRTSWNIATQREESQLRVELSGIRQNRTNIAHEYNAHVGMANRDLFRSRNLPEHLSDN